MQLRGIGANVGGPQVKVSIFIAGIAILAVLLLAALAIEAPARTIQFKTTTSIMNVRLAHFADCGHSNRL
jgi:hypothetical protein